MAAASIAIQKQLLAWFRRQKRSLPWRGTPDPYRIWVSEVMLQQTTVQAVRKRYGPFLRRFPDLDALARARQESVLAAWSGLGYYSRARNLWRAAREIRGRHAGRLPRRAAELSRLPGFGDYTAAAVAALAFGERLAAADANVTRVVSRLFALPGEAGSRALQERVLTRAASLLPRRRPGDLTAALMDLGQLVCTPRRPRCFVCPLAAQCRAIRISGPEGYPRPRARPKPQDLSLAAAVVESAGRALLRRRSGTWLQGLWEFPSAEGRTPSGALRRLANALEQELDLRLPAGPAAARARHTIVRRRLDIRVYRVPLRGGRKRGSADSDSQPLTPDSRRERENPPRAPSARWFSPSELERAAIPTLTRKIALACGFLGPSGRRTLAANEGRSLPPGNRGSHGRADENGAQGWNGLPAAGPSAALRIEAGVHDRRREDLLDRRE
jgi:A/G-specific adenine glycosylase